MKMEEEEVGDGWERGRIIEREAGWGWEWEEEENEGKWLNIYIKE